MDKNKSIRANLGAISKPQDSNKKDNNKQWPRNGRRREGSNTKVPDNSNKNNFQAPQRNNNNNYERRSKGFNNRGYGLSGGQPPPGLPGGLLDTAGTGLVAEVDDEEDLFLDVELNSVLLRGNKKQHNLNHLLNFHYAPRDRDGSSLRSHKMGGKKNCFNKEHFIQANYQFIVRDNQKYSEHKMNPDKLVDWGQIEEVLIRSSEEPNCPICLYPPVASRMTKCGHVYCWPCILHYLALSDKEWRKCPICYSPVQISDLKSTVSWPYHAYQLKETVDFQLMYAKKGSMLVQKMTAENASQEFPHLFDIKETKQPVYSKLVLANKEEILTIIDRERIELNQQLVIDGPEGDNCPETVFIAQALSLLDAREQELADYTVLSPVTVDHLETALESIAELSLNGENYYFFYQAVDGQYLYLNSINIRMLQAQFGAINVCPQNISGQIVHMEMFSATEEIRKKFKYLQYLPITCTFAVVEIKFQDGVISKEILDTFEEELQQRVRQRKKRAKEERLREKKIDEVNNRQLGLLLRQRVDMHLESTVAFPVCGMYDEDGAMGLELNLSSSPAPSGTTNMPELSFAKMLKSPDSGKSKPVSFWPTLESSPSKSIAAPKSNSGWARPVAQMTITGGLDVASDHEIEDSFDNPPNFRDSFKSALNKIDVVLEQPRNRVNKKSAKEDGGCKKNRKKQQLVLFSTGMNFNGN